jgi:hypothetical protein
MDIEGATLFKRRGTARVVAEHLGDCYEVIEVRLGKNRKVIRPRRAWKARPRYAWPKSRAGACEGR